MTISQVMKFPKIERPSRFKLTQLGGGSIHAKGAGAQEEKQHRLVIFYLFIYLFFTSFIDFGLLSLCFVKFEPRSRWDV